MPVQNPDLQHSWKVRGREVYCATFRIWLHEMWYCHVTLRLHPPAKGTPLAQIMSGKLVEDDPPESEFLKMLNATRPSGKCPMGHRDDDKDES